MIDEQEVRERASALRVPSKQVHRDHLLSHLIHSLQAIDGVVFIGGTALNRTHLPDLRLSEDLDIHLLEGEPRDVVQSLAQGVRLEFPDSSPVELPRRQDLHTCLLNTGGLTVQVQIIRRREPWTALPKEETPVRLYYSDLPDTAVLPVPSSESFGAMKLTAYVIREAPRDLFDLRGLVERGMLTSQSLNLSGQLLGRPFTRQEFERAPDSDAWTTELAHQVADPGDPEEALLVVRESLSDLYGW